MFKDINVLTNHKFLNMYQVDAVDRNGKIYPYYFVTRKDKKEDMPFFNGRIDADGTVIYALLKDKPDKIVLVKQYRYPLNDYIYELPAGLIDKGETKEMTAIREMKEETGLEFEIYEGGQEMYRRSFIQAQGMADECNHTVYGYASGEISKELQESCEHIEVVIADKDMVREILAKEKVSIRCAYLLMFFLQADKENPFSFLD